MHVVVVRCSVKVKDYLAKIHDSALRLVSTSLRSKRNVNPKGLVRSTSEVLRQLESIYLSTLTKDAFPSPNPEYE
jgi:hypothetical protein